MSENIITLTSSDEEDNLEPPPKKKKVSVPIIPQVTIELVPNTKKKNPIEIVNLDSDEEVSETQETVNQIRCSKQEDCITVIDDEEVQPGMVDKINDVLNSILGSEVTVERKKKPETNPVLIVDSDEEVDSTEKKIEEPCDLATDSNENIVPKVDDSSVISVEKEDNDDIIEVNEINCESNGEVAEVIDTTKESDSITENEKSDLFTETQKEHIIEESNKKEDTVELTTDNGCEETDNEIHNITIIENEIESDKSENMPDLNSPSENIVTTTATENIVIEDSGEETEKENHCEDSDIKPFTVNGEKTGVPDVPSTSLQVERFDIKVLFKQFLNLVEEKIVDSSFQEILPKKLPIIHKYFKRSSANVNEKRFETLLNDGMDLIKKSSNSNAANIAVLSFHKVFEHLKSHMDSSVVMIDEDHVPKVKKLERTIKLLRKRIKQLEETEVNFDDDEESAYIILDRYQARLKKVYAKYCQYIKRNPYNGRALYDKISFIKSKYDVINQALSRKYKNSVNFPSYFELTKFIEKTSRKEKLNLSDQEIKSESVKCFEYFGSILQKKRRQELYDSHLDFIEFNEDPAAKDISLENVLRKNNLEGKEKIEKLMQKYVDKQTQGEDHESSHEAESTDGSDSEENNKKNRKSPSNKTDSSLEKELSICDEVPDKEEEQKRNK